MTATQTISPDVLSVLATHGIEILDQHDVCDVCGKLIHLQSRPVFTGFPERGHYEAWGHDSSGSAGCARYDFDPFTARPSGKAEVLQRVSDDTIVSILKKITETAEAGVNPMDNRLYALTIFEAERRTANG